MAALGPKGATLEVQIDAWIKKAKGREYEFAVEFIQDLNAAVVRATPVLTGFLRGSWYAQVGGGGGAGAGVPGGIAPSGGGSIARMNLVATQLKPGQIYTAINGARYAGYVEFGTSRMRPRAFVRGTLAKAPQIAAGAARRVANRK